MHDDGSFLPMKEFETVLTETILCCESVEEKRDAIKDQLIKHSLDKFNWDRYCFFEEGCYTRNAVLHNDLFTVLILCWEKGCITPIHNHPCDGCFIVGLNGALEEKKYITKESGLELSERNYIKKGDINWIHDSMGVHQVSNPSSTERAVTLHFYHPPYNVCKGFNVRGQNWNCSPKYYSINGVKTDNDLKSAF